MVKIKISARNSFIYKRKLLLDIGFTQSKNFKKIENPKKSENRKSAVSPWLVTISAIRLSFIKGQKNVDWGLSPPHRRFSGYATSANANLHVLPRALVLVCLRLCVCACFFDLLLSITIEVSPSSSLSSSLSSLDVTSLVAVVV